MSAETATRWTPGPWRYEGSYDWVADDNANPVPVHTCWIEGAYEGDLTARANAHLIAAAPELYDALVQLVDDDECRYDHHGYCQTHGPGAIPCEMVVARAVLAKARGES